MMRSLVIACILLCARVSEAQWTTDNVVRVSVRSVAGQAPLAIFDQITWEQGLPKGGVRAMYRDRKGFLWLSVPGYGAIRYDGRHCRIFAPTLAGPSAFPATLFYCTAEDSKGILWFGTEKGLVRFDPALEQFELISRGNGQSDYVNGLCEGPDDNIWVNYSPDCLLIYDPKKRVFEDPDFRDLIHAYTGEKIRLEESTIFLSVLCSAKGNIWATTHITPEVFLLLRYNTQDRSWTFFPVPATDQRRNLGVLKYVNEDESKVLCMNWENHLWQLDVPTGRWTQYKVAALGVDSTITGAAYIGHQIWFTTATGAAVSLDTRTNTAAVYRNQAGDRNSPLQLSMMLGAQKDAEGIIWWPAGNGAFAMNPRRQWLYRNLPTRFTPSPHTDQCELTWYDTTSRAFFAVMPMTEPKWQLVRMDKDGRTRAASFNSTSPPRLMLPVENKILLGLQGLTFVDPRSLQFEHRNFPIANYPGWTTDSLWIQRRGAVLANGDYFLPTNRSMVLHYNSTTRAFFLINTRDESGGFSNGHETGAVCADRKGNVWLASSQGLVKIRATSDAKKGPNYAIEHFLLFPKDSLPDVLQFCNWTDAGQSDTIWVGANSGLYYLAPGSKRCYLVEKVNFFVSRLFCDVNGHIWFKYSGGIGRYQPKLDRLDYFDERDGVVGDIYDRLLLADDGTFFFRGAYRWRPEHIPVNAHPPPVVFTAFKVFEKDFPLDSSIDYKREVTLAAAQNFFSIGFAALNFQRSDKNEYAYRLIGVDTGWVYCGGRDVANYTNLAPGHYVFELKAANNDGIWSATPRRLRIVITPEWYQTLWFKWSVALALAAIAWFFFRARLKAATLQANLRREKAEREKAEALLREKESVFRRKLAETEMAALRAQMNPHFIFNCLNSIKLYTEENDTEMASLYLTKFSRLIRRVLENSRSEKVTLENELDALELYIQMEAMRFKEKIQYHIQIDPELDLQFVQIPPLLLQPFIENAVWHGLMHKPDGGRLDITLDMPDESLLRVTIQDNGIGRAKAASLKSKSATQHKSLGMQVTSERIEAINELYRIKTKVTVTDLTDAAGQACGTRVQLDIPII